jgi:hypothetical protein
MVPSVSSVTRRPNRDPRTLVRENAMISAFGAVSTPNSVRSVPIVTWFGQFV